MGNSELVIALALVTMILTIFWAWRSRSNALKGLTRKKPDSPVQSEGNRDTP